MARVRAIIERAANLHRRAVATVDAAAHALGRFEPQQPPELFTVQQQSLATRLTDAADRAAPGWLGRPLDASLASLPIGTVADAMVPARVGTAYPLPDAAFPVLAPILGAGHLTIAESIEAAGLLRSVLLRLVAATTPGSLRVRAVDPTGAVFAPFAPLFDGRLMPPPVTDRAGLRAVLTEAEQWVRASAPPGRHLVVVLAALPARADASDLARLRALAKLDAASRISLIAAGDLDLPQATSITSEAGAPRVGALDMPTELDPDPPATLIESVCARVAAHAKAADALSLRDLLPEEIWSSDSTHGLATTVGVAGLAPLSLRLNDSTPHWLICGRAAAGKSAFLIDVLYGLCVGYPPDDLLLYLLDFRDGESFREFTPSDREPTWIPHTRAVGVESDRAFAVAILRELDGDMAKRADLFKNADVTGFAGYRSLARLPRIVCVLDDFPTLLAGDDRTAREAISLLESIARKGRTYGIHLILSARSMHGVDSLQRKRDSIVGQFSVRIALPGGGDVLDVQNGSADQLRVGTAVVNTAGGLGGPNGASRAHERLVEFPDPYAEPKTLSSMRRKLWLARPAGSQAPRVFRGSAPAYPPKKIPKSRLPVAYVGHAIDAGLTPVTFTFDKAPGRHLAVIGPSELGASIVDATARSVAAQVKPGSVRFVLAPITAEDIGVALAADLAESGHRVEVVDVAALRGILSDPSTKDTYLVAFGMDGSGADLTWLLRDGPTARTHLIGWWHSLRRFDEDTAGRDHVAGLVLLNIPAAEISLLLGDNDLDWQPAANRALVHDRHESRTEVVVPYMRRSPE